MAIFGAAILTGGESTRMGRDKALLDWGGVQLIDHIIAKLEQVSAIGQIYLIGDHHSYRGRGAEVFPDDYPGKGPIGGIATALRRCEEDSLLVVAVDMPYLSVRLIEAMAKFPFQGSALVPCFDGLQPLHAIYRRSCLEAIEQQIATGKLKVAEFFEFIDITYLDRDWIRLYDSDGRSFENMNRPEDYQRLRRLNIEETDF